MSPNHQQDRHEWGWRLLVIAALAPLMVLPALAGGSAESTQPAGGPYTSQTQGAIDLAGATVSTTDTTTEPTTDPATEPTTEPATEPATLTIVQGNLESPQSAAGFQRDARTVLSFEPDVITYNEVAFRQDAYLAPPPGYALWRTPGQYTGPTPVAWRTDRWTAINQGTYTISSKRGIPPGKKTELGRRHANWVTLQGVDGRILSVVSVHIAPKVDGWADLRRRSVKRLAALVGLLDDAGPVLIGGDFNMYHRGSGYPADLFAAAGMVPTFDELGTRFPTYDHGGAIIDYVFRVGTQLRAEEHFPVELRSDHDALVARYAWTTDAPGTMTRIVSNPDGTTAERRAVSKATQKSVNAAVAGEDLWLNTAKLSHKPVYWALRRAVTRGVRVHVVTRSERLTTQERRLRRLDRTSGNLWVQRCWSRCADEWKADGRPSTAMVVIAPDGQPLRRVDVSRLLTDKIVERRTRATLSNGYESLGEARDFFARYM